MKSKDYFHRGQCVDWLSELHDIMLIHLNNYPKILKHKFFEFMGISMAFNQAAPCEFSPYDVYEGMNQWSKSMIEAFLSSYTVPNDIFDGKKYHDNQLSRLHLLVFLSILCRSNIFFVGKYQVWLSDSEINLLNDLNYPDTYKDSCTIKLKGKANNISEMMGVHLLYRYLDESIIEDLMHYAAPEYFKFLEFLSGSQDNVFYTLYQLLKERVLSIVCKKKVDQNVTINHLNDGNTNPYTSYLTFEKFKHYIIQNLECINQKFIFYSPILDAKALYFSDQCIMDFFEHQKYPIQSIDSIIHQMKVLNLLDTRKYQFKESFEPLYRFFIQDMSLNITIVCKYQIQEITYETPKIQFDG